VLQHFKLDISNASTLAAHALLNGLSLETPEIKYCRALRLISQNPRQAKKLFEISKKRMKESIKKRMVSESKRILEIKTL